MTQREEFEKWFFENGFLKSATIGEKMLMLQAWKAAKAQAVPEWIPVSERLPDDDDLVLVYDSEGTHGYIYTLRVYREFFDKFKCVTHWMPLPAVPEQNK